jgi:hypothetical protein
MEPFSSPQRELVEEVWRSYLDYAMSVIVNRQVKTRMQHYAVSNLLQQDLQTQEQDVDLRMSVRSALGMSQSPLASEAVERCEKWRVWDQPKPRLSYLLCQKARAPPGDIRTQHNIEVASQKFLLDFSNLFPRGVPVCVPRRVPTQILKSC